MPRPIHVCLALLAFGSLCSAARAEDLAAAKKKFARESTAVDKAEAAFWKEDYDKAKREAQTVYEKEWLENWGLPTGKKEVHYNFEGYRKLNDRYLEMVEDRCKAFRALAGYGADGMELLYKSYEVYAGKSLQLEKTLQKARPVQAFNLFDQRSGMELAGIERIQRAIRDAMGETRDEAACELLAGLYPKAEKADRKMHDVQLRDVILQVLAYQQSDHIWSLLGKSLADPNIAMRVLSIEALGRLTESDRAREMALDHLKGEKQWPVVAATLELWSRPESQHPWTSPKAVSPLIAQFDVESEGPSGLMRLHYIEALKAITGVDQGLNPANWQGWAGQHQAALDDGTYKRPEPEKKEGEEKKEEAKEGDDKGDETEAGAKKKGGVDLGDDATVSFFDIKSLSKSVVFLVDASDTLMLPAEIAVAKQKAYWEWRTGNKKQMAGVKTQLDRLIEECEKTMKSLHPTCKFNVILMMEDYRRHRFQPALVAATDANKEAAIKFLKAARPTGWASQLAGIQDAMELSGMPTAVNEFATADCDTVFLLSDGVPCGGWWMDSREVVRAFIRYNRFRRMTVHSIRIANEPKEDAEYLMEGLATVSGGTYIWLEK